MPQSTEQEIQQIADVLLLKGRSSDWHNALMDYGSQVLTSSKTGITPTSKQPKFRGSTRQMRGKIIRLLSESDTLTLNQIVTSLDIPAKKDEVEMILEQLICDRLVEHIGDEQFRIEGS